MLEPSSSEDEDGDDRRSARRRQPSREEDTSPASAHLSKLETVQRSFSSLNTSANSDHLSSSASEQHRNRATSPDATSQGSTTTYSGYHNFSSDRLQPSNAGQSPSSIRPSSPSPSLGSDSRDSDRGKAVVCDSERADREEGERKTRLQLYVFVIRCISYPFNAKQPNDITRRSLKVQKSQFEQILTRFQNYVKEKCEGAAAAATPSEDEFHSAVQSYLQFVLQSERAQIMVKGGGVSLHDFREIFRLGIKKRIKSLPEPEGSTKEVIINSWMMRFECLLRGDEESKKPASSRYQQQQQANLTAETILTKDQLYEMFQGVLSIKKFEHQLLFK